MTFIAAFSKLHPIFMVTGVVCHALACDYMHVKHMGIDGYFAASVVWLLVFHILPGSMEANVNTVFEELLDA